MGICFRLLAKQILFKQHLHEDYMGGGQAGKSRVKLTAYESQGVCTPHSAIRIIRQK